MTRTKWTGAWVIVAVAVLVATWAAGVAGRSPAASNQAAQKTSVEALLGQALQQEEVEGNLRAAISTYQKVIAAVGVTKAQAARAQLRIGGCYERLGMTEARKAYEAVVANYGDQESAVKEARARLAALGATGAAESASAGPTARVLWKNPGWLEARLSPDGRSVVFVDGATGSLCVRNLATSADRKLIPLSAGSQLPAGAVWSPDGGRIAYNWLEFGSGLSKPSIGFRVVDVRSGVVSTYEATSKLGMVHDWSPDGKRLLLSDGRNFSWFSLSDQAVTPLNVPTSPLSLSTSRPATVSPDGLHIAFAGQNPDNKEGGVFLSRADGSSFGLLLGGPVSYTPLAWTPDSTGLVVESRGSGRDGLWLLSLDGDRLKEPPRLLRDGFTSFSFAGLSRDGALLYTSRSGSVDLTVATVDLTAARVGGTESLEAAPGAETTVLPAYSPDGRRLAYVSTFGGRGALVVKTIGQAPDRDRVYFIEGFKPPPQWPPRWSADGRSVFVGNVSPTSPVRSNSVYRVELASGGVDTLTSMEATSTSDPGYGSFCSVSPDGRVVYGWSFTKVPWSQWIWRRDVANGAETELYRSSKMLNVPGGLSPDGKWLVFARREEAPTDRSVMVLPTSGGSPQLVCKVVGYSLRHFEVSADSQWLLFTMTGGAGADDIWVVPLSGGEPRRLNIARDPPLVFSLHPDGKHLVYGTRTKPDEEVSLLENFLPKPAKK